MITPPPHFVYSVIFAFSQMILPPRSDTRVVKGKIYDIKVCFTHELPLFPITLSRKFMPVTIDVKDGNVPKALMQLKRTLIKEGLFKELKKRKFYVKPSVARKLKREAAEKQRNKDLKRELRAAQKADF